MTGRLDPALRRPFPLLPADGGEAGRVLGALGFRLGEVRAPVGARVAVFGPGWGNLAIALARVGFRVAAIDPDPAVCAFVVAQGARREVAIEAGAVSEGVFDAAVIEEGALPPDLQRVVPEGPVYLMRDPPGDGTGDGTDDGTGDRPGDGAGTFRAELLRAGWLGRRRCSADLPWAPVWELSRWPVPVQQFAAADGRLGTIVGVKVPVAGGAVIRVQDAAAGFLTFGPHVPLPPGRYSGVFAFEGAVAGLVMDACTDRGMTVLARAEVPDGAERGELAFELGGYADEVEVRLYCHAGGRAAVLGLEIAVSG